MDSRSPQIGTITRSLGLISEWDQKYMDLYRSKYNMFVAPTNNMCSCLIRRGRHNMISAHRQFFDFEVKTVNGCPEVGFSWLTDVELPAEMLAPRNRRFFLKGQQIDEKELHELDESLQEETAMLSPNVPGTAAVALRYAIIKHKNPQWLVNEPVLWVPRDYGMVDLNDHDQKLFAMDAMLKHCISGQGCPHCLASKAVQDIFKRIFGASLLKVFRAYACSFEALDATLFKIPGAEQALSAVLKKVMEKPHAGMNTLDEAMLNRWMIKADAARFKNTVPWWCIRPEAWSRFNLAESFVFGRRVDITSHQSDAILCLEDMGYNVDYKNVVINATPAFEQQALPPVNVEVKTNVEQTAPAK